MATDRRSFLIGIGAAALAGAVHAVPGRARAAGAPAWIAARADVEGRFHATVLDRAGSLLLDAPLTARGHGAAVDPHRRHAVLFARRPGEFAVVLDLVRMVVARTIAPQAGRRFQGHGVFAPDGRLLYATENAYDEERGVIGVYDAVRGFARVGEFDSGGIGPHELILLPDGATLAVANGGILTHPDLPRAKLNVPSMDPSLTLVDRRDGTLTARYRLPADLHRLSIRHLAATADGTIGIALQYEGPPPDLVPLVALYRPNEGLRPLDAAPATLQRMRQYCGSAAVEPAGRWLAVSAPRGNLVTFWDLAGDRLAGTVTIGDGCGVAAAGAGRFLLTSGTGGAGLYDMATATLIPLAGPIIEKSRWDNHATAIA